jgi:hypothetical protein
MKMACRIIGIAYRERPPMNEAERMVVADEAWLEEMMFQSPKLTFREQYVVERDEEAESFMIEDDTGMNTYPRRFASRDAAKVWMLENNID